MVVVRTLLGGGCGGLLAVVAVVALALPPPAPAAQDADAVAPALPFPSSGERVYYRNAPGAPAAEAVWWFEGAGEALHRDGTLRSVVFLHTARPPHGEVRGSADALLEDPTTRHERIAIDAATLDRVWASRTSWSAFEDEALGVPGNPVRWTDEHTSSETEWYDEGIREPWSLLWGATTVADRLAWGRIEGYAGGGWGAGWGGSQLVGIVQGDGEGVRIHPSPRVVAWAPADLDRVGPEEVGGLPAVRFTRVFPGESSDTTVDLWVAPGLAMPVRQRHVTTWDDGSSTLDLVLAEHLPGNGPLPWGEARREPAMTPATGPLGTDGPSMGDGSLAYPLAEAVGAVRADPSLLRLQEMQRGGAAVLAGAFHEVRPGGDHPWEPLPEARWLLAFHDGSGAEVVVESKRFPQLPERIASNRELPWGAAGGSPYVDSIAEVTPEELPVEGPTLGGALQAWGAYGDAPGRVPTMLLYALTRMDDGSVRPVVASGWWHDADGAPFLVPREVRPPAPSLQVHFLALDVDGGPRYLEGAESVPGTSLGPIAAGGIERNVVKQGIRGSVDEVEVAMGR